MHRSDGPTGARERERNKAELNAMQRRLSIQVELLKRHSTDIDDRKQNWERRSPCACDWLFIPKWGGCFTLEVATKPLPIDRNGLCFVWVIIVWRLRQFAWQFDNIRRAYDSLACTEAVISWHPFGEKCFLISALHNSIYSYFSIGDHCNDVENEVVANVHACVHRIYIYCRRRE